MKVRCINNGLVFNNVANASEWANTSTSSICAQINGIVKYAGKHPITGESLQWEKAFKPSMINPKKVRCLNTGQVFNTVKEASEWGSTNSTSIARNSRGDISCAGKHPVTGEPLVWEYVDTDSLVAKETVPTKVCTKCGKELPMTEEFFYKNENYKDNFRNECIDCYNKYRKQKDSNPVNTDINITKVCTKCGKELPATKEYFYKWKRGKYGLTAQCKECNNKHKLNKSDTTETPIIHQYISEPTNNKYKSFSECKYTEHNTKVNRTIATFNYTGDINCDLEFDNNRGRTWRFIINKDFEELLTKRGFPKAKVDGFIYEILNYKNTEWVLAEYKDLIALRNPADRTTTIYPKCYWEDRIGSRFNGINIVDLNKEVVR